MKRMAVLDFLSNLVTRQSSCAFPCQKGADAPLSSAVWQEMR